MQYQEIYRQGLFELKEAGIEEAELDARLLLEAVCGTNRTTLLVHGDMEVSEPQEKEYREKISLRAKRIPLQHILGETEFMGLKFYVNQNVLCPRQDTEVLVEEVLRNLHDGMRILDMCTGSGCILLSLLHYSNDCQGTGADISEEALQTARENALRLDVENACFIQSDLFEKVEGKFDMIVSNPPYIETAQIEELMPEVRDYEPRMALDGGEDGLFFYRKIIGNAAKYLCGGGKLFFEIGCKQGDAVKLMMLSSGFREVEIVKDYAGLDRVVYGERSFAEG